MAKEVIINLKIDTTDGEMSIKSLEKGFETSLITIRDLEEAADALTEALKDTRFGTEQYEQLESQLLKVDKALSDQKASLQTLNYQQVGTQINKVVGGLTRMAGGLALVGVSGESIEKIAKTFAVVEGASRMVTGGLEAYNGIMKLSNNITLLLTSAQASLATAQAAGGNSAKAAAIGVRVLNAAMKANPVFLIISGITALVGALAVFALRTNEAADANDRLNKSMENTSKKDAANSKIEQNTTSVTLGLLDGKNKAIEENIKLTKQTIGVYEKFIEQGNKKYIPMLQEQKDKLKELEEVKSDLDAQKYSIINDTIMNELNSQIKIVKNQFESIRLAIKATSEEDYFADDVNYELFLIKLNYIKEGLKNINDEYKETGDVKAYQASVSNLAKEAANLSYEFTEVIDVFGRSARPEWEKAIKSADDLTESLTKMSKSSAELFDLQVNKSVKKEIDAAADASENLIELQEQLEKQEKERQDAIMRMIDLRRRELDDILSKLEREKKAISDLASEKAKFANDEIKLLEISYGEERQKIIDVAIAREKAAAQEQFLNGKLSKEKLVEELERIENDHNSSLLESEKTLIAELNSIKEQNVEGIKARKQRELQASIEGEQAIRSQMALEQLRFEMDMEISALSAEENTQENILEIKRKYAEKEKGLITQNLSEQLDVRRLEYEAEIAAKDISAEKKKLIEAKYLADIQKMNNDAAREIQKVNSDVSVASQELTMQQLSDLTGKIASTIQQATSALSDFLQNSADYQSAQLKTKNDEDAEAFKTSLANKEISQEKYDNKMAELEQKKEQQELAAKRKAFEQGKAIAISNAVMQTAQAVIAAFSSAAAVPIAGMALGPIMSGVAAAMGAAQIAVIAAQKFTASRGGKVPGQPSKMDSVDALLAPGEMVINAESSAKYPELLSAINQAGGGISLAPEPVQNSSSNAQSIYKSNEQQQTIKAFVVESEMTDAQRNVNRMRDSASWG